MRELISFDHLTTDDEWGRLKSIISPSLDLPSVNSVICHLKSAGTKSVLIEENYIDRDFIETYTEFYATVFKRHNKFCRRLHFFKSDITSVFQEPNAARISQKIEEMGSDGLYSGFIICRPIKHAPLGTAILALPPSPEKLSTFLTVRAKYDVHILGAHLKITGMPLTQQDSRVGACAQATIWMAGRHFHVRHRGPWVSTVSITDSATKITDDVLTKTLPAGSEFLGTKNMVRALRDMGRKPLTYSARPDSNIPNKFSWGILRPQDIINRYVDSGIPVILALAPLNGQTTGHAVVATGHSLKKLPANQKLPLMATRAEFCEYFLVNDDQRGANLRFPIRSNANHSETEYTVEEHVYALIVPLPRKVFLPAEAAERVAWDLLKSYRTNWDQIKSKYHSVLGSSIASGDQFIDEINAQEAVARTYLTYGWKYKARMLKNGLTDEFKNSFLYQELPKFVWVTEFGTLRSLNSTNMEDRRILAHTTIDATAARSWHSHLVFHAPGIGIRWIHNTSNQFGEYQHTETPIPDDQPYYPKVRGESGFDKYTS